MNIDQLKEQLKTTNINDFKDIRKVIFEEESNRQKKFIQAMKDFDINKLKEVLSVGVSFKNHQIWDEVSRPSFINPPKEFMSFFFEKNDFFELFSKKNKIENQELEVTSLSAFPRKALSFIKKINDNYVGHPEEFIKFCLLNKLEEQLKYHDFNEDTFWLGKKYLNEKVFSENIDKFIQNFANKKDVFSGYESIHKYIKENNKVGILFDGIKDKENLDFFKNNEEYGSFLSKESILLEHFMKKAIADAHVEKIKILVGMGVPFPEEKNCYSQVFCKTKEESLDAQKYIIENCEKITFGNQIVLKTLLHSSENNQKIDLIQLALERYMDNEIEMIPSTLKREVKSEVEFVVKYMEYRNLKNNIPEKEELITKRFKL
jgi:hypothetical protein